MTKMEFIFGDRRIQQRRSCSSKLPPHQTTMLARVVLSEPDEVCSLSKKNLEQIIQVNLLWEHLQDLTRYPSVFTVHW
jgi:hypothetical protein